MKSLIKLSQLTKYAPLSFKTYPDLYFDSLVKTSSDIPRGTELLEINTWISGHKMNQLEQMKSSIMSGIIDYITEINPEKELLDNRLRLFFQLSAIMRNKGSLLYDFVESLPNSNMNLPLYWNDPESTSSIPLRTMMGEEFLLYRNTFDKMFDLDKQLLSNVKFEEFLWINHLISLRAVKERNSMHVVPIYDSFPHSFNANTEIMREAAVIRVFSSTDIPAGSVLTRNYGKMNNYLFLLNFGFVPKDNPFHRVVFPLENIPQWAEVSQRLGLMSKEVLDKLENPEGLSMSKLKIRLFQKFTKNGLAECGFSRMVPDVDLETVFRIVFLNESDIRELGVKSYQDLFRVDFSRSLNPKNQRNVELMLFKASEMMSEILEDGFTGKHPLGRQIEENDKSLIKQHLNYYSSRF